MSKLRTKGAMACTICGKDIVLRPSATERARKYGQTPSFYTRLFTEHAQCTIAKRNQDTEKLIKLMNAVDGVIVKVK